DAWHISTHRNHTVGGLRAWKCGSPDSGWVYPTMLDAALVTPVVPLTPHTELRFWHWNRVQIGPHFGAAADGGLVEASINGGAWQQIYPQTGYDFLVATTYPPGPFPPNTPVFSGWFPWREAVFEITGYEGTIQFRFRFGSNDEPIGMGHEGWYIDDVLVMGRTTNPSSATPLELPLHPALTIGGPSPFQDQTTIL
ncbi:MAG: hypothetical protein GY778_18715, partial [bacterium]|nr:hypothetical protein [bacterium]